MINIKITVDGKDEIKSFISAFEREKSEKVKLQVKKSVKSGAKEIRSAVPVKSGNLKKSIKSRVQNGFYGQIYIQGGNPKKGEKWSNIKGGPYFQSIILGSKKVKNPFDFFFPIYERKFKEFEDAMKQIFK